MARNSHDREDLLRDATAFKSRVQFQARIGKQTIEVFTGFRSTRAVSLYFDQDPVYHFNDTGQLRRAFVCDRLVKAEKGQLVAWLPQRSESQTSMLRQEMNASEQATLCQNIQKQLDALKQAISTGDYTVEGQISPEGQEDVIQRLANFLAETKNIQVAASPHVSR